MVALSSAMVGAHDTMQVLVTNQTPCHVKVAIDGRNGTIEPWKNRTQLQDSGAAYECRGDAHLLIRCDERAFQREGHLQELASRDPGGWILDVGAMVGGNGSSPTHPH